MKFRPPKGPSSQVKKPSEFRNSATALITKSGNYFVNYHGLLFLFFDKDMKYLPWVRTKTEGSLPNVCEYNRLHPLCEKVSLTPAQETSVWRIIVEIRKDIYYGLSRTEAFTAKQAKAKFERQKLFQHAEKEKVAKKKVPRLGVYHAFEEIKVSIA